MGMQSQKIRIRLKAFDYRLIDQSALEIVDTAKRPAPWSGPGAAADAHSSASMYFTRRMSTRPRVNSSRFGVTLRLMDIMDPNDNPVDALMKLDLPAGVDVEIKL